MQNISKFMTKPKIAIIHDAFAVRGGAEKVAYFMSKVFPEAPVYTTVYLRDKTFEELKDVKIKSHFLSKLVQNEKQFKRLYPIWFLQMRSLHLNKFDYVLSSSTYLAKFIHTPKNGKHISYLHAPFRLIWNRQSYSDGSLPLNSFFMKVVDKLIPYLQKKDLHYTQKIDKLVTNSKNMQLSIEKIYQRDSTIIHPPIEINQYYIDTPEDFYLCVGRLISHKRIDLVIKGCNQLKRKLVIVGDGLEKMNWVAVAGETIQFVNNVDDRTLKKLFASCKALIFPSNEDFGIVPIEVQASGRPVIAFKAGGVLETVTDGVSGVFFNNQSVDDIIQAIEKFEKLDFSSDEIRSSVEKFDFEVFKNQYLSITQEN
jgi:glycosyltransferase involved in cell wall biosynthesis